MDQSTVAVDRQISAAPDAAAGFGPTVFMDPGAAVHRHLTATGLPQITFNYLGQPADELHQAIAAQSDADAQPPRNR